MMEEDREIHIQNWSN